MKKKALAGMAAGLLALSLAACSGTGTPPTEQTPAAPGPSALAAAQGTTSISIWHGLGGKNGEAFDALIKQFNDQNKGKINVTSNFQGSYTDLLAKYTAGLRDNSSPTVLLAGDIASGYLNDVKRSISPADMAKANPDGLNLDEIRDAGKNYYSANGKIAAVPMNMSTPVLWVNKDLLAQAGVDPSTPMTTLSEVATVATKVKNATGKAGIVQPFDGWWFEQMTAGSGNLYCTPDNGRGAGGQATAVSLTADKQKAAFKTMADLYTSKVGLDVGVDGNAALTAFTAGQVALMLNSSGAAGGIGNGAKFNYTALPYPTTGDKTSSGPLIGGSALWLSSTASDAQKVAGWKLISFLAWAQSQETFSQATGYVPVNTKVDTSPTHQAFLKSNPSASVFAEQINKTPSVPATAGCLSGAMTAIRSAVVSQMQAAFSGTVSLENALKKAEEDSNKAISQYRQQLG
ncbi:extracellular solute-binding protein [bacterium RCC_150]